MRYERCPACDKRGNGDCAECFGTGRNVHLNQASPACPRCGGSGKCPKCEGTGKIEVEGTDLMPDFVRRLLDRLRR